MAYYVGGKALEEKDYIKYLVDHLVSNGTCVARQEFIGQFGTHILVGDRIQRDSDYDAVRSTVPVKLERTGETFFIGSSLKHFALPSEPTDGEEPLDFLFE